MTKNYNDCVCSECGFTPREYGHEDDKPWDHWACPDHYSPYGGGCEGTLEEPKEVINLEGSDQFHSMIYCIGGPLNDNKKGYTKEQMADFSKIADLTNI